MNRSSHIPRVSIGMPVFNGERHLKQALDGILGQSFRDFELVICDNASTDATETIARRYAAADDRVRYVRHPRNIGAVSNFRFALDEAVGPYFAWAAHDDVWESAYLERLVRILDDRSEVVLAFSRFDNIDSDGQLVRRYDIDWNAAWQGDKFSQLLGFIMQDPAQTQRANHIYGLIRREALLQSDEFFAYDGMAGSDALHLYALLCRGNFAVDGEVLFHYRVRTSSGWPPGAGFSYLWRRMFGATRGHGGNLLGATRKILYFYLNLSRMVMRVTPLPLPQRLALATLAATRGFERLGTQVPRAVIAELTRRALG